MRFNPLKSMIFIGTAILFLFMGTIPVQATLIKIHFKVEDFTSINPNSTITPTNKVVGNFRYEADPVTGDIISLSFFHLNIDGHNYSMDDIGFMNLADSIPEDQRLRIGALVFGVDGLDSYQNDFYFDWYRDTLEPFRFRYTSSRDPGSFWTSANFTQFRVTAIPTAVPEPATLLLFCAGLVGLLGLGKRFRK